MMNFKYHHTNHGFCRVCFTVQGAANPKNTYYYCIQEDIGDDVKMYRCSNSHNAPWEPEYSVIITGECDFDLPTDINKYSKSLINKWKKINAQNISE
jgi:hypothetical protein